MQPAEDLEHELVEVSEEVWSRRASARQRQIDIGKGRPEYGAYLEQVPLEVRTPSRPTTPNPHARISKRQFDQQLSSWRRRLHDFDHDAGAENTQNDKNVIPEGDRDGTGAAKHDRIPNGKQKSLITPNGVNKTPLTPSHVPVPRQERTREAKEAKVAAALHAQASVAAFAAASAASASSWGLPPPYGNPYSPPGFGHQFPNPYGIPYPNGYPNGLPWQGGSPGRPPYPAPGFSDTSAYLDTFPMAEPAFVHSQNFGAPRLDWTEHLMASAAAHAAAQAAVWGLQQNPSPSLLGAGAHLPLPAAPGLALETPSETEDSLGEESKSAKREVKTTYAYA